MSLLQEDKADSCFNPQIIPRKCFHNVINYKYRGEDRSYLYVYVLSPLADKIANALPMWLAPNIITTFGFTLNIISHLTLLYYQGFGMEGVLPNWAILMTALFYLTYIMLDNTDGKQARRTHSSSVLGMLLDHGWDGYNSIIIMINLWKILQVGNNPYSLMSILIVWVSFYFATLESFYIGGVYLPEVNAVSDGALLYVLACIFAVLIGPEWLASPIVYNLRPIHCVAILSCFAAVIFVILNLHQIFYRQDRVKDASVSDVFQAVMYVITITAALFIWPILTPGDIFSTPVPVMYLYGLLIIRPANIMQLYLVTGQDLSVWKKTSIFTVLILTFTLVAGKYVEITYWHLSIVYWVLVILNAFMCARFVFLSFKELSIILDINIFSIQKQIERHRQEVEYNELN